MKTTSSNTETRTNTHESTPDASNPLAKQAMDVLVDQLPVAIAMGRDSASVIALGIINLAGGYVGQPGNLGSIGGGYGSVQAACR